MLMHVPWTICYNMETMFEMNQNSQSALTWWFILYGYLEKSKKLCWARGVYIELLSMCQANHLDSVQESPRNITRAILTFCYSQDHISFLYLIVQKNFFWTAPCIKNDETKWKSPWILSFGLSGLLGWRKKLLLFIQNKWTVDPNAKYIVQ